MSARQSKRARFAVSSKDSRQRRGRLRALYRQNGFALPIGRSSIERGGGDFLKITLGQVRNNSALAQNFQWVVFDEITDLKT